ncbi:serine hydrolase domain-containing protein [Microlunatus soli]|uniref:CubicO group peptidase, beta-lactamase class C family n=1 Tax=Microlunatus soli TaxID=630515 RepID=A0A1H1TFU3_9ACTN|nr:serine hydrolase domain-containing protein [Microlunatus soli]SDS59004.1 CubicO group peptidase, beta-lactamase class C family [Microlunatus soli]
MAIIEPPRRSRRVVLSAALGGTAAALTGSSIAAASPRDITDTSTGQSGTPHRAVGRRSAGSGTPTITADDLRFTPHTRLRRGRARQVGLEPGRIDKITDDIGRFLSPTPETPAHPEYAGAAVIAVKDGVIVANEAAGKAVRYGLADTTVIELPADQQIDARTDTIWDLASMSKLFTATAVVQLIEQGLVGLQDPVVDHLPAFASHGKSDILIRHLLTHTSGLIPDPIPSLWKGYDNHDDRVAAILDTTPHAGPGVEYVYSDINFMTLGLIVEKVSGQSLDRYVHDHITAPLGMRDTMYNPPASLKHRIAAQEYEPWADRGLVWGSVHDENAWALDGVAGHAGVFSTVGDMAIFAQTYLNGGSYRGTRILRPDTVRLMLHDYNGEQFPTDTHGLGWELGLVWYHAALWSPVSFGHTGFTGTSIVVDPIDRQFVILMTNRVHPDREWGSNNPSRRAVADDLGLATTIRPNSGRQAWFSGRTDKTTTTLDVGLPATADGRLDFDLWYDTEPLYDYGRLQSSTDGSTFAALPFRLRGRDIVAESDGSVNGYGGRRWLHCSADLPDGTTRLRWSYQTDSTSQGRGIYLDDIVVRSGPKTVFDSGRRRDAAAITTNGWHLSPGG